MALHNLTRALRNRDYDVPDCLYRLIYIRNGQKLVAGIACVVEINTKDSERQKYYLLSCKKVTMRNLEDRVLAQRRKKSLLFPKENLDIDIKSENCFTKKNFCFLTPSNEWKPEKSLKAKATENPPDSITSLILEDSHKYSKKEWKLNSETGEYQPTKIELLEDHTLLGSPVLWKDPETERFYVIGAVDRVNDEFKPRLFKADDLINFGYPEITEHPPECVLKREGDNVTLSFDACGNPLPELSWTKDEKTVTDDGRIHLSDDKKELTIENLKKSDCGEYKGVATFLRSKAFSRGAQLKVQCYPEITEHPQSVAEEEGKDVTLSCEASGDPEPEISWCKDSSPLTDNDRIHFSKDKKRLTLKNLTRADSGEYQSLATNSVSVAISSPAVLNVQYEPKITIQLKNITKASGQDASFFCDVDGNPEPKLLWYKDGFVIQRGKKTLERRNLSREDSGEYKCEASNDIGKKVYSTATLKVTYDFNKISKILAVLFIPTGLFLVLFVELWLPMITDRPVKMYDPLRHVQP